MSSIGFKFAKYEHRWEKRTNITIVVGIIITSIFYYYKWNFSHKYLKFNISASESGLFFLILVGIVHFIARLSHKGEQVFLKKNRPWRRY